jgi:aconitate hydratase
MFRNIDNTFSKRAKDAKEKGGGIIIGGENYGQGSSREHAAMAPMFLGLQAVIAKAFARIHSANLINFGILPLQFKNPSDYEKVGQGDRLVIKDVKNSLNRNQVYNIENITKGTAFEAVSDLNDRQKQIIMKGGLLPYTKQQGA